METEGEISSPGFPTSYDNHMDWKWLITVDPAFSIRLDVFTIDIEDIPVDTQIHRGCASDSLRVRFVNRCGNEIGLLYTQTELDIRAAECSSRSFA